MDLGYEVIFTITGMVLVFLILILLMVIIKMEGRIFDTVSGKKREPEKAASQSGRDAATVTVPVSASLAQPQVEQGIPGEVVAAIMAAVYTMGNGKYKLKAVRRNANNWGRAGIRDATAPF